MFSLAAKTNNPVSVLPQKAPATFFKKADGAAFFDAVKTTPFFGSRVQAKLQVSSPADPQEKEADAVAGKVMAMAAPVAAAPVDEHEKVQRQPDAEKEKILHVKPILSADMVVQKKERAPKDALQNITYSNLVPYAVKGNLLYRSGRPPPDVSTSFQQNLSASKGAGNPLPNDTRSFMESRFNADFANVRVHTNAGALQMSSQVQAHAFTHGNDIYFNSGKYAPHTSGGKTLLAHELTHTIQQGASPAGNKVAAKLQAPVLPLQGFGHKKQSVLVQQSARDKNIIQPFTGLFNSGGFSLSTDAREYFEDSLKADVSDIRIHADFDSASLCRSKGVPAYADGNHLIFDPSNYAPDTEEGGILLANKIAESLQQRSINVPGLSVGLRQGISEVKKGAGRSPAKHTTPDTKDMLLKAGKKKPNVKQLLGKDGRVKTSGKRKKIRKGADAFAGKMPKPNPAKSPSSPAEDAAFYKVVKKANERASNQKKHDDPVAKATHAQRAAHAVPNEAESAAKKRKADGMDDVAKEDKPFDVASFKAELLKKIAEVTPQDLESVDDFKENNKIPEVKSAMAQKVVAEKDKTAGPVENATRQPLQVNEADNKKPVALPPTLKGNQPQSIGANDAAPKPKLNAEISMDAQSQSLDTEMQAGNITEGQLAKSNEPSFTNALDEKKGAQKDAKEKPLLFRRNEARELKSAQATSTAEASKTLTGMFTARGKDFDGVVKQQQTTRQKDEHARAEVILKIQAMYHKTEDTVTNLLTNAETLANTIFDTGSEKARIDFETYVDREMTAYKHKRYSGFWGGLRWGKDKLFGMPGGVNKFYVAGRQRYLEQMDQVITHVAHVITTNLNSAKLAIKNGKKQIAGYVSGLKGSLKNVGAEAAENIQDKFDSLEQTVNDKKDQLVDGLARKYVDNLKKIDDRITELKQANKGLVDKAIGLLKEVARVIKNLYNLFQTILSRISSVIGLIIADPGKFFDNLGAGFSHGFERFKNRIGEHLENGLMAWLSAQLGIANLQLPDKFDVSAVLGMVMQVVGLSYGAIRERAVVLIGEDRATLLEKTADAGANIFQRIRSGGLGALWDLIKEKLTDFKDMVWEAIKTFIKESVIKAALTFILSLLNPVAAFIKACMAIYQFIMMLVRMKDRIIDLLNSIMDAVAMIASGAVDKAAAAVEMAFAKSIPIIIGFLAALLGLNDIGSKVKGIMLRIQDKIHKVIDWVLTKAYSISKPAIEAAMRIKNKGVAMYEKGKGKVVGAGKKVVGAVANWLGIRKTFKAKDNTQHNLFLQGDKKNAELMVATTALPVRDVLKKIGPVIEKDENAQYKINYRNAQKIALNISYMIREVQVESEQGYNATKIDDLNKLFKDLSENMSELLPLISVNNNLAKTNLKVGDLLKFEDTNKYATITKFENYPNAGQDLINFELLNTGNMKNKPTGFLRSYIMDGLKSKAISTQTSTAPKRQLYLGTNPKIKSDTGQKIKERMKKTGKYDTAGHPGHFQDRYNNTEWHPLSEANLGHVINAVNWWNSNGRFTGAKSSEVAKFMNDPDNYELEDKVQNQQRGSLEAAENVRYLNPDKVI